MLIKIPRKFVFVGLIDKSSLVQVTTGHQIITWTNGPIYWPIYALFCLKFISNSGRFNMILSFPTEKDVRTNTLFND